MLAKPDARAIRNKRGELIALARSSCAPLKEVTSKATRNAPPNPDSKLK